MKKFIYFIIYLAINFIIFYFAWNTNNGAILDFAFSCVKNCINYLRESSPHLVINSFPELSGTIFFTWDVELAYLVRLMVWAIVSLAVMLLIILIRIIFILIKKIRKGRNK